MEANLTTANVSWLDRHIIMSRISYWLTQVSPAWWKWYYLGMGPGDEAVGKMGEAYHLPVTVE